MRISLCILHVGIESLEYARVSSRIAGKSLKCSPLNRNALRSVAHSDEYWRATCMETTGIWTAA